MYDENSWDLLWEAFITPSTTLIIIRVRWKHSYLFDSFYLFAVPELSANRPSLSGTHSCFKLQNQFESLAFWTRRWGRVTHRGLDTGTYRYQEALPVKGFAEHKSSYFPQPSRTKRWRGAGHCLWAPPCCCFLFSQVIALPWRHHLTYKMEMYTCNPLVCIIYFIVFSNNLE